MAPGRDIRTHAFEIKFLVAPDVAAAIRVWARTHLEPDPHGSGPDRDEYQTTSVYFDTDAYDVFHRRGSFGRSKYRIRRYGEDNTAFLERKLRSASVLAKRRTPTTLVTLYRLTQAPDPAWPGHWFHRRLAARGLMPVCQVAYQRMARTAIRDGALLRLTLDSDVRARALKDIRFHRPSGVSITNERAILELKYAGPAPALFKDVVERFGLTAQPASKYRLGVAALAPGASVGAEPRPDPAGDFAGA
jgi:hypothetical protein